MDCSIFKDITKTGENLRVASKKKHDKHVLVGGIALPLGIIIIVISVVLFGQFPGEMWTNIIAFVGFAGLVVGLIFIILAVRARKQYESTLMELIRNEVDKALYTNVVHKPNNGFPLDRILYPGFFAAPDKYISNNYTAAVHNGMVFDSAYYNLQKRQETKDSKGNTTVTYVTYAAGTLYHFVFERKFNKTLKVLERSGLFGTPGGRGLQKAETEYLEFNKKFDIYTSDDTFTFYILTPQLQEKFLSLEKVNCGKFYFALMNNEIFIAVQNNGNFPKPSLKESICEKYLATLALEFILPAMMIDELGLYKTKYKDEAGTKMVQ